MTDPSPAAKAVLDAAYGAVWPWEISKVQKDEAREVAAAVIRTIVKQAVPIDSCGSGSAQRRAMLDVRHQLLTIALELEALND